MSRIRHIAAAATILGLLIAGCSPTSPTTGPASDESAVDQPTTQEADRSPTSSVDAEQLDAEQSDTGINDEPPASLKWNPCGSGLECAELLVPLDHFGTASTGSGAEAVWPIAIVRRPATGTAVGSIVVNPGGPGASGVDFVSSTFSLGANVDERFDLIGFDPRGVGASGTIDCRIDRSNGPLPDYQPDNAAERDVLDRTARSLAERCLELAGPELSTLSTSQVVEDLEMLRRALGESKLNFVGLSYGTYLGAAYAQRYPASTGRLVLDGVVNPDSTLDDLLLQQSEAFAVAGQRLDDSCRQGSLSACPDAGALETFDAVLEGLEDGTQGEVGPTELAMATLFALYTDDLWPTYLDALTNAQAGNAQPIERLSDFFLSAVDFVPYAAYVCNDLDRPTSPQAWDELADRAIQASPRLGAAIANELRVCAHWPDASPAGTDVDETGWLETEALIVGTTGDAATPVANSRNLHNELPESALVVVKAARHTSVGANSCLDDVVEQYLIEGSLPESTVNC